MLQILLEVLTITVAMLVSFLAATRLKRTGRSFTALLYEFELCLADSPAQVAFFMFSVTAAIAICIITTFSHIASLLIVALEIMFLLNSFLLLRFHRLKLHP